MDVVVARWVGTISTFERGDPVWDLHAYRVARYLLHLATGDVRDLPASQRCTADQLIRAVASISANVAEGHSRPSLAERTRFLSYALGSTREAVTWYATFADTIGVPASEVRAALLTRARRLVFGLLRAAKSRRNAPLFPRGR